MYCSSPAESRHCGRPFCRGRGEVEAGTVERGALGGALTDQSTKGEGRVIWKGSDRAADDVAAQVIRLNAAGTGTDAILKSVLLGPDGSPSERVKAYADTETAASFLADRERRRVWHGAARGLPLVQRSGR